ncbi:hypothetical protein [Litorihabitans aurantiacus]|uniref:Uncharacterized protein n=1 Tax=Litorihabitans aurantiacus TaxID=1930061 RepID=A0AA37UGK0_9MICO|nr:hypothetical protein [Litorihabitans aurantiacus]GMA30213.1 hypothetical protein GCM10025875_02050 [Litorihabitans aurantiacus]
MRDQTIPPEELAARALDSWGLFWLLLIGLSGFFALASYAVAVWFDRRSIRRMDGAPGRPTAARDLPRRTWRRRRD